MIDEYFNPGTRGISISKAMFFATAVASVIHNLRVWVLLWTVLLFTHISAFATEEIPTLIELPIPTAVRTTDGQVLRGSIDFTGPFLIQIPRRRSRAEGI